MTRYYHCSSTSFGYFDLIVQCFLIVAFLLLLLLVAHRSCVSFSILFLFHCNAVSNSSHTFKFPAVCSLVFVSLLVAFVFCFFCCCCCCLNFTHVYSFASRCRRWRSLKRTTGDCFFSLVRFQATALFCNIFHLAGRFSHIAWFRFDLLVFSFFFFWYSSHAECQSTTIMDKDSFSR